MAGLDPAIHDFLVRAAFEKTWMPGTRPGMTKRKSPTTADESDDPFVSFTEWSGEVDEKAYGELQRKASHK